MPRQLHLSISDDLDAFLRSYASEREVSIAAAVRIILRQEMRRSDAADA
jgi:hypothetical protein